MKTKYFICLDRNLTLKETDKYIYTRVLNKYALPIEVRHNKEFLNTLEAEYS